MTTTTLPAEANRVRPLWERGDLFREPEYANGEPYAAGDDEDDEPPIITA
jgi:hypothetical protein